MDALHGLADVFTSTATAALEMGAMPFSRLRPPSLETRLGAQERYLLLSMEIVSWAQVTLLRARIAREGAMVYAKGVVQNFFAHYVRPQDGMLSRGQ